MHQSSFEFSHQLIKGKIAEMIFEQMLRETNSFTVLGFGYEKVLPELMRRQSNLEAEATMEIIRRAPDFAIIDNVTHEVQLVEVKYRAHKKSSDILSIAHKLHDSWKPAYLFLCTPKGFYFGKAQEIISSKGDIASLTHMRISLDIQNKYLDLLNKFIRE